MDESDHTELVADSETSGRPGLDGAQEHTNEEVTSKSGVAEEPLPERTPLVLTTEQTTTTGQDITASSQGEHKGETLQAATEPEPEEEPILLDIF